MKQEGRTRESDDMVLYKACTISELMARQKIDVVIHGIPLLIVKAGEKIHAIGRYCPHAGEDLLTGVVEGNMIICPRHGATFSLKTGEFINNGNVSALLARAIAKKGERVYRVVIKDEDIFIEI
ncbi:MAG: Rieske (2Fe-2S) protein [Promethearchaeota archaeon]